MCLIIREIIRFYVNNECYNAVNKIVIDLQLGRSSQAPVEVRMKGD